MNKKIISCVILLLIVSMTVINAQVDTRKEKTEREHNAVKEAMRQIMSQYPVNKNEDGNETEKIDESIIFGTSYHKTSGAEDRKNYLMNGNRITVELYNYGGIGPGYGLLRNVNNFVWRDLGYLFQFGPIVGALVQEEGKEGKTAIISDGLNDYTSPLLQEVNPADFTERWQWQPLPGYADPDQPHMASNPAEDTDGDGKPDSWPRDWYNETLGQYVWPGFLSQNVTNADQEVYWAMDDRDNIEFNYFPFENDRSRKGLGLQVDGRAFQWSNALAENTIFFVYTITNVSSKPLDSVFFGIYGDPDVGGGSPENTDDNGFFVPPYSLDTVDVENVPVYARSMVYFFDPDKEGPSGLPLGYLGCKFLESPGNSTDGIDNDGDGMIDESQEDNIDNDGDWNPAIHDVGLDGIPNTGDFGENDGIPTAGNALPDGSPDPLSPGEPNFEFTDLDESDQIGLTSFNSWTWNQDKISDDQSMWNRSIPGNFGAIQQNTDLVFIFGSGYISLEPGETKRISMALICGEDLDDLLISAEVVQTIYNQNYQFFKPPITPTVSAVPGDKKVTLYWDTAAEESIDPITGKDFEGYVIYRSTDPTFEDIQVITDGKGSSFLSEPLKDLDGNEAKWDVDFRPEPFEDLNGDGIYNPGEPFTDWDGNGSWSSRVEDPWKGYHPVAYQRRGIQYYLGDNTGLVHSFVDSNNVVNGQTYYYAVVAYDHGDSNGIPVSETTKKITQDPITSKFTFGNNTVQVIPGPRSSGYVNPKVNEDNIAHVSGRGTGDVEFKLLNDLSVKDDGSYLITFSDSLILNGNEIQKKNYTLLNNSFIEQEFPLYGTKFTTLANSFISEDEPVTVKSKDGTTYTEGSDYIINYKQGSIKRTENSPMQDGGQFNISYKYYPIFESTLLDGDDANPVFDGIALTIVDEEKLALDEENVGWISGNTNLDSKVIVSSIGAARVPYPADYEIVFSSQNIDTAVTIINGIVSIPVNFTVNDITTGVPKNIKTFLNQKQNTVDSLFQPGESIILFSPTATGLGSDTLTWELILFAPTDTLENGDLVPVVMPTDGDVFQIKTLRPFNTADKFQLTTQGGKLSNQLAKSSLDDIYVVPNPYVGYNEIEPRATLPGQVRGERRIYFENLPSECTIRIYTLSGTPVAEIEHESGAEHGRAFWNLLNTDGFGVAYGVYIAHIDAPNIGEKILKFALIK